MQEENRIQQYCICFNPLRFVEQFQGIKRALNIIVQQQLRRLVRIFPQKIHVGKLQIEQLNEKPFTLSGYPCKGFSLSYHSFPFDALGSLCTVIRHRYEKVLLYTSTLSRNFNKLKMPFVFDNPFTVHVYQLLSIFYCC